MPVISVDLPLLTAPLAEPLLGVYFVVAPPLPVPGEILASDTQAFSISAEEEISTDITAEEVATEVTITEASSSAACLIDTAVWAPAFRSLLNSNMNRFWAGQALQFTATFIDPVTEVPVDPDQVQFSYAYIDSGNVQHTISTIYGAPGSTIIKTDTGTYQIKVDSTGRVGQIPYVWASTGVYQALISGAIIIDDPSPEPSFS